MKKGILLLALLIYLIQIVSAQKEANHWYFGQYAGFDFSSGSMEIDTDGQLVANHGCAVSNNEYGDLQFYTNGFQVWNRNHEEMPNGFISDSCAGTYTIQNCAIVPKVGERDKFYIFTTEPYHNGNNGLRYSIVDLSLDNYNGDVTETCILVTDTDSLVSGCTITRHTNEVDYWLFVHGVTQDTIGLRRQFQIYLIDENGINLASTYLSPSQNLGYAIAGKFSPNGKYLYWSKYVFDFDNTTGEILDYRALAQLGGSYSIAEFSPNSQVLYATAHGSSGFTLDQFDLTAPNLWETKIEVDIETDNQSYMKGGLQLAPDGKIYVSNLQHVGVINYPNNLGVACGLEQNTIDIPGLARWDFPNFSSHIFQSLNPTSTINENDESSIHVFPNPANEMITLELEDIFFTHYELMNVHGVSLLKKEIDSSITNINVSHIPTGTYLIRLSSKDAIVVKKVVIH